jgi:hypothetical protein
VLKILGGMGMIYAAELEILYQYQGDGLRYRVYKQAVNPELTSGERTTEA